MVAGAARLALETVTVSGTTETPAPRMTIVLVSAVAVARTAPTGTNPSVAPVARARVLPLLRAEMATAPASEKLPAAPFQAPETTLVVLASTVALALLRAWAKAPTCPSSTPPALALASASSSVAGVTSASMARLPTFSRVLRLVVVT